MTIRRVVVAVDDSPAALRAARVAIDLAKGWRAELLFVTVAADHTLDALLDTATTHDGATERVAQGARTLLARLADTAGLHGLDVDTVQLEGEPFRKILDQAQSWEADIIVMGQSDRRGPSSPYLGSVTAHVLEFAECLVLVVPRAAPTATDRQFQS